MNKQEAVCPYFHFGLIVTGKGESQHLIKLFKSLVETRICTFEVIRFVGQRTPITSKNQKLKMINTGKSIPDKDAEEIGLPTRKYLGDHECGFVMLIDDLEYDRRQQAHQVFERYRQAFDTILTDNQKRRVAVHFLVNMLEAYYFADTKCVNSALNSTLLLDQDHPDDVEEIRHPKNELKRLFPGFDEIEDGGKILELIDIKQVLSKPDTCASLRTLFAWCVKIIETYPYYALLPDVDKYNLNIGILSAITGRQLANL